MASFDHAAELEGCARRDRAALRRLYDREAGFLLAVAQRIVRRREVAADVIHDAFLDIWERAGTFDRAKGTGRAWITSIVRYRALKHVRRAGREAHLDVAALEAAADEGAGPLALLAASQDAARLHGCLSRLEVEHRQAIMLAYVDGLSHSEIAERLEAPLGTVKSWVRRSLLVLRKCLS